SLDAEFEHVEDTLTEAPDSRLQLRGHDEGDAIVEVWSSEGVLLLRNPELRGSPLDAPARDRRVSTSLKTHSGMALRVLSQPHRLGDRDVVIRVAASEEPLWHEWRELGLGLLVAFPVALVVAGLGGHWLARRALAPIDHM